MIEMRLKLILLIFISTWLALPVSGQDISQVDEETVALQRDYIDADLSLLLGDYESAIEKYSAIYKSDRSNHAAAYGLARCYAAEERIEDAKKHISVAINLAPENRWYLLWHANYYRDLNEHEVALTSYRSLYDADKTNRYFAENYAYSLLEIGQTSEAIAILDAYEQSVGRQELLTKKKWSIYDGLGQKDAALKELMELAKSNPSNARLWLNAAKYADGIDEGESAKLASGKALELNPLSVEAKQINGKYASGGLGDTAQDLSSLMSDPKVDLDEKIMTMIPMVNQLAQQQLSGVDAEKLERYSQAISSAHPQSAKALALRADVLMHSDQYEAAVPLYKRALSIDDSQFSVCSNLLYLLLRLEQYQDLAVEAEKAIDYFPNEVYAYYYYSRALAGIKDSNEALSIANEGLLIAGKNLGLQQLMKVAQAYSHMAAGDMNKASEVVESLDTGNGWVQELLGDLALKKGDRSGAKEHYNEASTLLDEPRLKPNDE